MSGSVANNTAIHSPPIDKASTSQAKDSTVYLFFPIMYQLDDYRNLKDQITTLTSINTTHLGRKKWVTHIRKLTHDRQPSAHVTLLLSPPVPVLCSSSGLNLTFI